VEPLRLDPQGHVELAAVVGGMNDPVIMRDAGAQKAARSGMTCFLLALFSERIGEAYVTLLESLGIASVWKEEGSGWTGSTSAVAAGLVNADTRLPDTER
jgi:hypothetical protein